MGEKIIVRDGRLYTSTELGTITNFTNRARGGVQAFRRRNGNDDRCNSWVVIVPTVLQNEETVFTSLNMRYVHVHNVQPERERRSNGSKNVI